VKPGLTGLWQVSGRSECTYEQMVKLDVEYVRRRTLPLDLSILARTVRVVVTRRGAA
jgi:lipopolysaccharide/colanic/teichoic acid biosynthesis glycosyltransferase